MFVQNYLKVSFSFVAGKRERNLRKERETHNCLLQPSAVS